MTSSVSSVGRDFMNRGTESKAAKASSMDLSGTGGWGPTCGVDTGIVGLVDVVKGKDFED